MNSLIKKIRLLGGVNFVKTLYFNFHYFPFFTAIRLPVFIHNRTKLLLMRGHVKIECPIRTGIIKIGVNDVGTLDYRYNRTIWQNSGDVLFKGKVFLGSGSKISVNKGAKLVFGDRFCITGGSSIICSKHIHFGCNNLLSWDILIMDSDLHNIYDYKHNRLNYPKDINIGDNVWIGCRSLILKGVNVADGVIIGAGSKIVKDIHNPNSVIVGVDNQRILKEKIYWKM